MKLLKVVGLSLAVALGACSKNNSVPPEMAKALQKKDVKNLQPDRILSLDETASGEIDNWFTKDPELDKAEGVSAEKAYMNLDLPNKKEIIVAVVDSGVDINHEDLQGKIWINKGEIADNGIDDDKNGYIDDVYGWNFIGGHDANGKNVNINQEQLEVTRELVKMKAKKAELESQGKTLSPEDAAYLAKINDQVTTTRDQDKQVLKFIDTMVERLKKDYDVLQSLLNVEFEKMNVDNVKALKTETDAQAKAQQDVLDVFAGVGISSVERFASAKVQYQEEVDYYYNEDFHPRTVVGDNPDDLTDVHYGNNDVTGPDASHGTHVAGIIAANRDNKIGIKGVAENVKIMVVRVVPNGDERDKDVALAIRYAADNGANVINMSFGKAYSPRKDFVGAAFKYAESKGVLMVHAAGNESTDKDQVENYPTRNVYNEKGEKLSVVDSWLDVGASSQYKARNLTAAFTNYGQTTVDLFAPGVNLKSSVPGNQYAIYSGTSMASPTAAGVAALVWSQNPDLTASQLKAKLMGTTRSRAGLMVQLPSNVDQSVPFETLSITGGIIDAYAAISSALALH